MYQKGSIADLNRQKRESTNLKGGHLQIAIQRSKNKKEGRERNEV